MSQSGGDDGPSAAASRARHRRPRYEQLGAPALLHRQVPSYTLTSDGTHAVPPKPHWEARAPPELALARSQKLERRRHRQRDQAFPEYCATFGAELAAWGLEYGAQQQQQQVDDVKKKKSRLKYYGLAQNEADEELIVPSVCRNVPPSPADFGNCLLVMPCRCCSKSASIPNQDDSSSETNKQQQHHRTWFVVHPSGHRLDSIAVTRIQLPQEEPITGGATNDTTSSSVITDKIPIGERILQITMCGSNKEWDTEEDDTGRRRILLVRTQTQCLVVECAWVDAPQGGCGGGHYSLSVISSVEYFGSGAQQRGLLGFAPIYVAASPYTTGTSGHAPAVFALLSHSALPPSMELHGMLPETSTTPKQNVVHRAIVYNNSNGRSASRRIEPSIHQHTIDKLCLISQVEFSRSHPMVLWASGRSSVMHKPGLYHHGKSTKMFKRPASGRGTNLCAIDLRSNEAALVFNPSHAERMVDGLHSISAILPDQRREHKVFVQSISAGSKTWEIDDRMPDKSLCSWALPGLCDDWGVAGRRGGLYGLGSLLTQPVVATRESHVRDLPLFGLSKSYATGHLGLYQRPEVYPRFCTQAFEASCNSATAGNSGFALSSSFVLPDASANIFNYGLAVFEADAGSFLSSGEIATAFSKECSGETRDALCVISMTSRGDLYGHALVDSSDTIKRVARSFDAVHPGVCAIPVPEKDRGEDASEGSIGDGIRWKLCNDYPIPSSAILPQTTSKDDMRPSITFNRCLIPANTDKRKYAKIERKINAEMLNGDSEVLPLTQYERDQIPNTSSFDRGVTKTVRFAGIDGTLAHCVDSSVRAAQSDKDSDALFSVDNSHASISIDTEKSLSVITGKARESTESDEDSDIQYDEEMELSKSILSRFQGDWAKPKGKVKSMEGSRGRGQRLQMSSHHLPKSGSSDDEQFGSI